MMNHNFASTSSGKNTMLGKNTCVTRREIIAYVKKLSPWAEGNASPIVGGKKAAYNILAGIDPLRYSATRNYSTGTVTRLSPYITHGLINLQEVRQAAMAYCSSSRQIYKFLQELSWRDFWQHIAVHNPTSLWQDIEEYKTGWQASDYQDVLPDDIRHGRTGIACLDSFIHELLDTGYLHNHARMYLASYVVHFRRVKWQAGARWFLSHLLDGDLASNNFSWQWVASTFSHKPYIFNLENVHRYFSNAVDTSEINNKQLNYSYDTLSKRLFNYHD